MKVRGYIVYEEQDCEAGQQAYRGWHHSHLASVCAHFHARNQQRPNRCRYHDAKPISPFWTFWLISFLITNTKAEPKAVPRKGISSEVMTIGVESDMLKCGDAFDFNHCILREALHCEGATCWERSFKIF